jgi:hypothetical protein
LQLFEKNTLFGRWCPVHRLQRGVARAHAVLREGLDPVPGHRLSSLATGSQVLVLNPGVEICAPV